MPCGCTDCSLPYGSQFILDDVAYDLRMVPMKVRTLPEIKNGGEEGKEDCMAGIDEDRELDPSDCFPESEDHKVVIMVPGRMLIVVVDGRSGKST